MLYKFYEDRDDIADNLLRPWKGDIGGALEHSAKLVSLIYEVYEQSIVQTDEGPAIHAEEGI